MIEMRIVDYGPMCRPDFQYRHFVFGVNASGALYAGNGWSDWKVAEWVKADDYKEWIEPEKTEKLQEKNWYVDAKTLLKPKEPEKWDVVRESVKWCEEHPDESVEDYLKPKTPEETEKSLREAFQKVQQTEKWKETQRKIDSNYEDKNFKNSLDLIREWGEKNKPPTLYEILMDWWINHLDMEQSDEEIVDGLVNIIGEKFIPPSRDRNGYEWEKCLKMMREKLR